MKHYALFLLSLSSLFASENPFPGVERDPSVPAPADVVGFDFGERMAMHHEALAYARALADASPKVSLHLRGRTWEGRSMALLIVTGARNQARLDQLQARYQALADPRRTSREALTQTMADLPVAVLLQESVHGNEPSGTDSGLLLAWHLASARGIPEIDRILDDTLVLIELMQNPDGRDHFISYSRQTRAPGGDTDPQSAAREESWAPGRYNHYLFDMNRDWFGMTQPETRTKIASFLNWYPQVVVDLHEMGSEDTFFAAQPSPPLNPVLSPALVDAYGEFGKAIGRAFDERGIDYFHGEIFDGFYPGYGESWPSLHGAMGVLFEQASARGLAYTRLDGSLLTHRDAVNHHAIASFALLQHAAANRIASLSLFYNNRAEPLAWEDESQVFLLADQDITRVLSLGRLLLAQGIEVEQVNEPIKGLSARMATGVGNKKRDVPAGSLLVRLDQPAGKLARTLLSDQVRMDADFLARQERRMALRKGAEIYDVTAWSLPLLHGVDALYAAGNGWKGRGSQTWENPAAFQHRDARLGFLIGQTSENPALLAELLGQGIHVSFTSEPIRQGDTWFPRGSLIIKKKDNPDDLGEILARATGARGIAVTGVDSAWFAEGPSFGSAAIQPIRPPAVALLWDRPAYPLSAGWMRYVVEQEIGYPCTVLKAEDLGQVRLAKYDVLLMPDGSAGGWSRVLGKPGADKLAAWLEEGGLLLTIGGATAWLVDEEVGLLNSAREWRGGTVEGEDKEHPNELESDPDKMILPRKERPQRLYGALLRVRFDPEHWMCFGMLPEQAVMALSDRVFRPLRLDSGANPGRFSARDSLLMSGYVPEDALGQIAHKPFLMVQNHGRGLIVAFSEDPNFRGFMKGLRPLLTNALFFGPAQTR